MLLIRRWRNEYRRHANGFQFYLQKVSSSFANRSGWRTWIGRAMKLQLMRYFTVLAKELHFGRAAQRLNITQPPLSSGIMSLEEELGCTLFERTSKHVRLTAAGRAFQTEIEKVFVQLDSAVEAARLASTGASGRLTIAIPSGIMVYKDLADIMRLYRKGNPGTEVRLLEMSSADQPYAIAKGEVQVGFLHARIAPPYLASLRLSDDPFVLCVPNDWARDEREGRPFSLGDIAQDPVIMFSRSASAENYDNVIAAFHRANVYPRIAHAVRTWQTSVAMVANGFGVALVPSSMKRFCTAGLEYIDVPDCEAYSPSVMVWSPNNKTATLECFIACAKTIIAAPVMEPRP